MVRLCRFNSRIYLFIKTLQYSGKALLSFGLMFSIIFFGFVFLFYFLFISKMQSCATLLDTIQMLFEMTVMKFDTHELVGAAAFLGPFCFSLFIIIVVFICVNMFLSIINQNFRIVRKTVIDNEHEIFSFMLKRFQNWTGKN